MIVGQELESCPDFAFRLRKELPLVGALSDQLLGSDGFDPGLRPRPQQPPEKLFARFVPPGADQVDRKTKPALVKVRVGIDKGLVDRRRFEIRGIPLEAETE